MNGALTGDFEQFGALLVREITMERDLPVDPIEHALLRFTVGAVLGVDLGVT